MTIELIIDESETIMNEWMNNILNKMVEQQYETINEIKNNVMESI